MTKTMKGMMGKMKRMRSRRFRKMQTLSWRRWMKVGTERREEELAPREGTAVLVVVKQL